MIVPSNILRGPGANGPQPSEDHLLMAAAIMHELGQFKKPNISTADKLKNEEKVMEGTQRFGDYLSDEGKNEGLKKPIKEQGI